MQPTGHGVWTHDRPCRGGFHTPRLGRVLDRNKVEPVVEVQTTRLWSEIAEPTSASILLRQLCCPASAPRRSCLCYAHPSVINGHV